MTHVPAIAILPGQCQPPASSVTVTVPNGGEVLAAGTEAVLSWSTSGIVSRVDLQVSRDDGVTWEVIARDLAATSYTWSVTPPASTRCRLRVLHSDLPVATNDSSNATFTITGAGAATSTQLTAGCWPTSPVLSCSPPHLGLVATLSVLSPATPALAEVFAGLPLASPIPIGGECSLLIDPATIVSLTSIALTGLPGSGAATISVPSAIALFGLTVRLQGAVVGPSLQTLHVTNAVDARVGF